MRKTNQIDAEKTKQSQFVLNRKPTYVQEEVCKTRDLSRFYQSDRGYCSAKTILLQRSYRSLPELENILSTPSGEQYWNLVIAFLAKDFIGRQ